MPTDKDVRQAQFTAQLTHLILEQFAQRFNQLHVHAVGKAANIMMALDRYRWPAGKADAFNDIWVKSALCQEIGSPDLACFFFEHINEGPADELRSEEHTSELQSLMRISYAVFCLKKKNNITHNKIYRKSKKRTN